MGFWRARRAPLLGPLRRGEVGTTRPEGARAGGPRVFVSTRTCCRKPRPHLTDFLDRDVQKARLRGALLFGYFLLGKQEKVTRPPPRRTKPCGKFATGEKSQELDPGFRRMTNVGLRPKDEREGFRVDHWDVFAKKTSVVSPREPAPTN